MNDAKQVSEVEAVKRERAAFVNGVVASERARLCNKVVRAVRFISDGRDPDDLEGIAAREYPMPQATRPRVVTDADGDQWSIRNGALQFRIAAVACLGGSWGAPPEAAWNAQCWGATSAALADLIANPDELVDAE